MTAENVAERWDVAREEMDRYAQRSRSAPSRRSDDGFFEREMTPYPKGTGPSPRTTARGRARP